MGMKQKRARAHQKEEVEGTAKLSLETEVIPSTGLGDSNKSPHKEEPKSTKRKRKRNKSNDADDGNTNKDVSKSTRHAQRKSEKAQLKLQLQSKIPTHDPETGIPYNKIQVRRMMRRVKHGLSPIPTEEEENEIRAREKRERMEEEALMYAERRNDNEDASNPEKDDENSDSENGVVNNKDDQDDASFSGDDNDNNEEDDGEADTHSGSAEKDITVAKTTTYTAAQQQPPPTKKAKRNKPVPTDYICQACQNNPQSSSSSFVPHWIYDCPVKKTQRGCNQISKKLRGLHDPPSHKVFVSGLPFECDEGMVKRFFEESMMKNDGKNANVVSELVHCKLLKFEDSNRCKGQAFLTFDSEEGATLAIRVMNGSIWKEIVEPGMATKGKKKKTSSAASTEGGAKKELKLKVTKALNRFVTKKKPAGK
jgi:hypothetical protein